MGWSRSQVLGLWSQRFRPSSAAICGTSLSPRPLRFTTTIASRSIDAPLRSSQPRACDDSSAGMMPSRLAQLVERLEREVVAAVVVLDAADLLQVRVLGADRRIVEARGDRVRLGDLPELVLQHHRARAVQHAERAAGEARGMLAELPVRVRPLRRRSSRIESCFSIS